ncbi:MAG TPA: 30S ribosomal protein S6 [Candidatus Nealsonbacteria bacterium]|uniref:30S ribosomal protein S6 n=1 Tax=marine sediment metagenome TaxID=412755 RepID=A0A0F9UJH9_9ZZZZ|nr:30S ribosomal protein S6 [Candidatus Nealsonbacteria bacterium]HEB46232.1 30S ribosomal protein S6 [Candidatus Nealsonbacteria bacterium]
MKLYELTYFLSSNLNEEELKNFSEKIFSFIKENEGTLVENSLAQAKIVKKKLASPIKKESQAYLNVLSFYFDPQKIEKLKVKLTSESQILRYVILAKKIPEKTKIYGPLSIISKAKDVKPPPKKVDLKEIEKKLEEILGE